MAAIGTLGSVLLLLTAGRTAVDGHTAPSADWFGLVRMPSTAWGDGVVALGEIAGVALLIGGWLWLLRLARTGQIGLRTLAGITAGWATPLAVGPPLLSLDAYSYLAQGHLQQLGLDPYRVGPQALGSGAFLDAVDPRWRAMPTPYGPLGVLFERLCAAAGPTWGLVVLHLISVLAVAGCGVLLMMLVRPGRRPYTLALGVANPLVLLELVGAGHWESLICLSLLGSLVFWRRGHPLLAIVAASASTAVKVPMLLAVVVLAALHVAGQESTWARARAAAAVVVASLAPWMVLAIVQPDLLGFLSAMSSPLSSRTVWGPSTALAELLGRVTEGLGVAVAFPTLLTVVQLVAAVVGAAIVATLVVSARRRPVAQTIGLSLLVVVLLSPVVYPWYLAWGVLPLVAAGVNGRWLVRLSAFAPFTALPGCQYLVVFLPSDLATAAALAVSTVAAAVAALLVVRATREVAPAA